MTDFLSLSFDSLNQFHFLRPLWLLAIVPLLILWFFNSRQRGRTQWHQIIPPHLAHALLDQPVKHSKYLGSTLALIWTLTAIALAGPTWQKIEKPVFQIKRASVIVMDMSLSMRSTDLKPDRLTRAKFKAIDLATAIGDGEVALVAYAGDAFTISPLTPDARNLTALIPSLTPEIMPEAGSYPLLGLEQAAKLLQQAGYVKGDIFWITDGIDQDDLDGLREFAGSTQYRVSVLGVGTTEGAPIKLVDGSLLKDHTGSIVIPRLNASMLTTLPNMTNGVFVPLTANDADVKTLAALTPQKRESQDSEEDDDKLLTGDDWHEFGPYLILLILPFLLLKFRRGEVLSLALLLLVLPVSEPTYANDEPAGSQSTPSTAPVEESWFDYVFKTRDQVAHQAYQQEKFAEAQQRFENPAWQGSAAYKNGDYESALERYSKDNSATGWYNRGNTLAQLNKFEEAIEAYQQAIDKRPGFEEAKENKALLEKMLQQQHDQQQQDGENQQNQDQQGGQQQQSEQQDSDQQSSEQSQSSDGEQQQNSQQQSSSNSPQPSEQNDSEQQSQSAQQQNQQEQQDNQQQSQNAQAGEESEGDESEQSAQAMQPLTPEQLAEQEQQQKLEQLLRKVSDDPATLLRNKMILENRRRQRSNTAPKGAKKSW